MAIRMSETHGFREQCCLDQVRSILLPRTFPSETLKIAEAFNIPLPWPPDETRIFRTNYFGMSWEDKQFVDAAIIEAAENPQQSKFPDFITPTGFIEHFQVTSSKESRKGGAAQQRQYSQFVRNTETELSKRIEQQNPAIALVSKTFVYPEHNYNYFIESFKKNWENHICSRTEYVEQQSKTQVGIFMIEYDDGALKMAENPYADCPDGYSYGDIVPHQRIFPYRLPYDKALLKWIYRYAGQIQYVIFKTSSVVDVLKAEQIPIIQRLLPYEFLIYAHPYQASITNFMAFPKE